MATGVIELLSWIPVFGEGQILSQGETIILGVVLGVVVLAVVIALIVRMQRRGTHIEVQSCPQCNSMNVQRRAGLIVCADCGHSVKTQEAEA